MAQQLIIQKKNSFLNVTFNRPRKGNLFTTKTQAMLADAVTDAGRDEKIRAIVMRANGKDFCHGREQKLPGGPPKNAYDAHNRVMSQILAVYHAFRHCPAPIISVVHGKALGFGCALVGGSDIAYATDDSRFALPEMSHGTAPTLAMAALAKVHPKVLTDMVLSMKEIDAQTALGAGLLSRVYPAGPRGRGAGAARHAGRLRPDRHPHDQALPAHRPATAPGHHVGSGGLHPGNSARAGKVLTLQKRGRMLRQAQHEAATLMI